MDDSENDEETPQDQDKSSEKIDQESSTCNIAADKSTKDISQRSLSCNVTVPRYTDLSSVLTENNQKSKGELRRDKITPRLAVKSSTQVPSNNCSTASSSQPTEYPGEPASDASNAAGPSNICQRKANPEGLHRYLKLSTRGKEILKEYQRNNNFLPKTTRSKLVRLVIQREKDWLFRNVTADQQLEKFKISRERFIILANEIVSIFEHECAAAYYLPFKVIDKIRVPPTGKLLDHFNYEKDRLRKVGLLAKTLRSTPLQTLQSRTTSVEENEKLLYLKCNVDDWDVMESYWDDTFEARRRELLVQKISTFEFIDNYLCLQVQRGTTLIAKDFEKLYPNKKCVSSVDWIKIKTCIKHELKEVNNASPQDQGLIHTLSADALSGDQEDFLIFYLLPCLITSKRPRKRTKGTTPSNGSNENEQNARPVKLSLQERRETFILHVMTPGDVETAVAGLQDKLKRNGQTFQPLIVAVGEIIKINNYIVIINDQQYIQKSCLEVVVLAFKIFFVLDCNYPDNSLTLWLFVQKCLFSLDLGTDVGNISLTLLLGRIANKLKETANL